MRWCNLIRSIPDFYIRAIVDAGADVGLPKDRIDFCSDFLIRRRERLANLFVSNRDQFKNVTLKLWDQEPAVPPRATRRLRLPPGGGPKALRKVWARIAKLGRGDGGEHAN